MPNVGNISRTEFEQEDSAAEGGYAMEVLFRDHCAVMTVICLTSLILGIPLAVNMLHQLKVRCLTHFCLFASMWPWREATTGGGNLLSREKFPIFTNSWFSQFELDDHPKKGRRD